MVSKFKIFFSMIREIEYEAISPCTTHSIYNLSKKKVCVTY